MTPSPFALQRSLFKAYDIRGQADLFSDDFVAALANAFAQHYKNHDAKTVAVAYDTRQGSLPIAHRIACALEAQGIAVEWLGLCTTPAMAYWSKTNGGFGVIATASHSPKPILGIKWLTRHASPTKDDIALLFEALKSTASASPIAPARSIAPAVDAYADALEAVVRRLCGGATTPIVNTLVIDCLDGASSAVASRIFGPWAKTLIVINARTDGAFLKGNPDPVEPNRLRELRLAVLLHKADLGLAFDGDGDRLAVVDAQGRTLSPDALLYFLAKAAMEQNGKNGGGKILFDVKCLHTLPALLQQSSQGKVQTVLSQTGSSHLRRHLGGEHKDACFAGELSGHFIFNDAHFINHDDGVYAALRLLVWLDSQKTPLSDQIDALPKAVATSDIYFALNEGVSAHFEPAAWAKAFCAFLQSRPPRNDTRLILIDGARMEYQKNNETVGFWLIRASNTSRHLTARFAASSNAYVDDILRHLRDALDDFANAHDGDLQGSGRALARDLTGAIAQNLHQQP